MYSVLLVYVSFHVHSLEVHTEPLLTAIDAIAPEYVINMSTRRTTLLAGAPLNSLNHSIPQRAATMGAACAIEYATAWEILPPATKLSVVPMHLRHVGRKGGRKEGRKEGRRRVVTYIRMHQVEHGAEWTWATFSISQTCHLLFFSPLLSSALLCSHLLLSSRLLFFSRVTYHTKAPRKGMTADFTPPSLIAVLMLGTRGPVRPG
jgi:hypothetical protein